MGQFLTLFKLNNKKNLAYCKKLLTNLISLKKRLYCML